MDMKKEIKDDGSIFVQGDVEVKIPPFLTLMLGALKVSPYVVLLILALLVGAAPRFVMDVIYGFPSSEILQSTPPLVGIALFAILFFGMLGILIHLICSEMFELPKMASFGIAIGVTLLSIVPTIHGSPRPASDIYIGLLEVGSMMAGCLFRGWTVFVHGKAEELYIKEVQKQVEDIVEKEILPDIRKDINGHE